MTWSNENSTEAASAWVAAEPTAACQWCRRPTIAKCNRVAEAVKRTRIAWVNGVNGASALSLVVVAQNAGS